MDKSSPQPWSLNCPELSPNFQALSAFRILFASYLLVRFFSVLPYWRDFYGSDGIAPLDALASDHKIAGLTTMLPAVQFLDAIGFPAVVTIALPLSLVTLAVGYRARWSCAAAFFCDMYLFWRNPYVATGAEILARLLLLWCLFLPLNRYWSVDSALDPLPRRRDWPALPFFSIRLQIASLYFFSGLFKLEGEPWLKGYALTWILQDDLFSSTPAGLFLVEHASTLLNVVNYLVIAFQVSFPFLIYCPWRKDLMRAMAIGGSAVMHISFITFLRIGGFPYLCLIMLLLLVPDAWIDSVTQRRRNHLRQLTIFFEPACSLCEKLARLLREFFLPSEVKVLPASSDSIAFRLLSEHQSWVLKTGKDEVYLKWRAVAFVLMQRSLTVPLAWLTDIPPLRPPMARFYDWIRSSRATLATIAGVLLPFRCDRPLGRFALVLNCVLMMLALLCNLASLDQWSVARTRQEIHSANDKGVRTWLEVVFATAQVRQVWTLFSPVPTHSKWSFRFKAITAEGNETDITHAMPFVVAADTETVRFSNIAWVAYFSRSDNFSDSDWRALGAFLCRKFDLLGQPAMAIHVAIERFPVPYPTLGSGYSSLHRLACPLGTVSYL